MSTTDPTVSEMLTEINCAIMRVLKKQSYRIGDIEYTFADLRTLREMRKELLQNSRTAIIRLGDIS
jgi:hypothetical protein